MIVLPRASHAGQVAVIRRPRSSPSPGCCALSPGRGALQTPVWGGGACVKHHSLFLSMEYQASVLHTSKGEFADAVSSSSCPVRSWVPGPARELEHRPVASFLLLSLSQKSALSFSQADSSLCQLGPRPLILSTQNGSPTPGCTWSNSPPN